MDSTTTDPSPDPAITPLTAAKPPSQPPPKPKDFLTHLEIYLAKRDGVDKLLKISRYASKIILASSVLPETLILTNRLKKFESSVGLSRKAFRLGKFVQDINAIRNSHFDSREEIIFSIIAYGGYVGSVALKIRDLRRLNEEEVCLRSTIGVSIVREIGCGEEEERMRKLKEKMMMKKLSIVQDFADGFMALADVRDGKGRLSGPVLVSGAGLLSALISTHKNWSSC
ncbi:Peroxisomal membrane protein 11A [Euphorbia peplus]|nr:Peroxisomal membrane protein 11A [Euphorbia peplus]